MRTLEQVIASLPAERRAKVTAGTQELIAEERALRHLREAHNLTQQSLANLLHMDQASVSKIERRTDMLLSTLRSYVEAMGGSLRLVAEFPDGVAELPSLGEALDSTPARRSAKRKAKGKAKRRQPELVSAT